MKPTLVVMAAGMGSRYGGLKQIEAVSQNGHVIMEYSIYDAIKAGFGKVVFIIKEDNEQLFREKIGYKIEQNIETEYVFQDVQNVPNGFNVPHGRTKPWGTAHAVLSCKGVVKTNFAVINADDFYGYSSFEMLANYLTTEHDESKLYKYCMVGFELQNTLTENGHVARGVCEVDENTNLLDIIERTRIENHFGIAEYTLDGEIWEPLPCKTTVSMNTWGFSLSIFDELEKGFPTFFTENAENIAKAEYFLPSVVGELVQNKKAQVKVLPSNALWYGVTYREDLANIVYAIEQLTLQRKYPKNLWK